MNDRQYVDRVVADSIDDAVGRLDLLPQGIVVVLAQSPSAQRKRASHCAAIENPSDHAIGVFPPIARDVCVDRPRRLPRAAREANLHSGGSSSRRTSSISKVKPRCASLSPRSIARLTANSYRTSSQVALSGSSSIKACASRFMVRAAGSFICDPVAVQAGEEILTGDREVIEVRRQKVKP
jgi:hypothetical protein